jgi:hypothetical protein
MKEILLPLTYNPLILFNINIIKVFKLNKINFNRFMKMMKQKLNFVLIISLQTQNTLRIKNLVNLIF